MVVVTILFVQLQMLKSNANHLRTLITWISPMALKSLTEPGSTLLSQRWDLGVAVTEDPELMLEKADMSARQALRPEFGSPDP